MSTHLTVYNKVEPIEDYYTILMNSGLHPFLVAYFEEKFGSNKTQLKPSEHEYRKVVANCKDVFELIPNELKKVVLAAL
jgi:hypothetical protein